jgi:hypothetical protein
MTLTQNETVFVCFAAVFVWFLALFCLLRIRESLQQRRGAYHGDPFLHLHPRTTFDDHAAIERLFFPQAYYKSVQRG